MVVTKIVGDIGCGTNWLVQFQFENIHRQGNSMEDALVKAGISRSSSSFLKLGGEFCLMHYSSSFPVLSLVASNNTTVFMLSLKDVAPPVFNGEGWVVKMRTYLQAFDLWEVINTDVELAPLLANPTVAQIRQHADERTKRHKAMSCIQNCVSDVIFSRIMACELPSRPGTSSRRSSKALKELGSSSY
ncbi:hypothetical protein CXB51_010439 [Gossypium anomalum]|uniref:DUF4219 domain-containing protein n=1 Tax=Gossypium anomalum TaxID=47600 RepID=A0A8J5YMI1_9ROSI|nr:hypothetical protein CXB51_010439 [Gossypium anomalum]